MNSDQVNLLSGDISSETNHTSRNNGFYSPASKSIKRNFLIFMFSLFIATCLTIYLYLNLVAINGNQSDQSRYKPLARRKPILDHESIFSDSGPSMLKLSDLLAHCIVAVQIAGNEVVRMSLLNNNQLSHVGSKGKTKEGVDDVVTGADMKSHEMILSTIKDSYRRLRVVSEEDTTTEFDSLELEDDILPIDRTNFANRLRNNLFEIEGTHGDVSSLIAQHETLVWIDPLDATKEYSENLTSFVTLMACIVYKSVPIAGVIHKPFTNLTYWSVREDSKKLIRYSPHLKELLSKGKVKSKNQKEKINVIVSRSHQGHIESMLGEVYGDRVSIITAGGSGYKTIELLEGNVDAYVHSTQIKKWDICAPHAILRAIKGANLTDLKGAQITFGDPKDKVVTTGLVASLNSKIHSSLVESFQDHME